MKWRKLGLIYAQTAHGPYLATHATNPLPIQMDSDVFRIFYSSRDSYNRSSIGAIDYNMRRLRVKSQLGLQVRHKAGSYYSDGISVGDYYYSNGSCYILFMGWQVSSEKHWTGSIGRIKVSPDFELQVEDAPFVTIDDFDAVSLSYPCILKKEQFYMYYGSTYTWNAGNDEMIHVINCAVSENGEQWKKLGLAIPFELNVAQAFSRPTVVCDKIFRMWYSYRGGDGKLYRIGYAESKDGIAWERKDYDVGIDVSGYGWDSEMICYPYVFDHEGERYMLYNGNGYGKTGFGLAILEKD